MVHAVRTTRCDIERGELLVEQCATTACQNLMENCCSSCYHFDLQIFVKHAILVHKLSLLSPPPSRKFSSDAAMMLHCSYHKSQVTTPSLSRSRPNLIINRALQFEVSGSRRCRCCMGGPSDVVVSGEIPGGEESGRNLRGGRKGGREGGLT